MLALILAVIGLAFLYLCCQSFLMGVVVGNTLMRSPRQVIHHDVMPHTDVTPSSCINLFVEYYSSKSMDRQEEINFSLETNHGEESINHLYVIVGSEDDRNILIEKYGHSSRMTILLREKRLSYGQFFALINQYSGDDDINIVANSDIIFDSSINQCRYLRSCEAIALGRWELPTLTLPLHGYRLVDWKNSQDTWIFRGRVKPCLEEISFKTGTLGCDHRLAYLMENQAGYQVINPCQSIITYHAHRSGVRSYIWYDRVKGHGSSILPTSWK